MGIEGGGRESWQRSIIKTFGWRVLAILNSFGVLVSGLSEDALWNALGMNLTGFILYYFYERVCNQIPYGFEMESEE